MKIKILNPVTIFLSLIAGVTLIVLSLIFTWNFWVTLADGTMGIFFGIFGVINDFGKVILLPATALCVTLYFYTRQKVYIWKALFFSILWIVCFVISLISSQGFDLNQKNKILNQAKLANEKAITESTSFKRNNETFEMSKNSAASLEKEITELKATKEKKIKESSVIYQSQYDSAKKKFYIDTPKSNLLLFFWISFFAVPSFGDPLSDFWNPIDLSAWFFTSRHPSISKPKPRNSPKIFLTM